MDIFFVDDDHAINRYHEIILGKVAENLDLSISFHTDPVEVMDSFEQQKTQIPDIIFLDINMPIMNGWDFLNKYQENNFTDIFYHS